jgi:hypothetical protein
MIDRGATMATKILHEGSPPKAPIRDSKEERGSLNKDKELELRPTAPKNETQKTK